MVSLFLLLPIFDLVSTHQPESFCYNITSIRSVIVWTPSVALHLPQCEITMVFKDPCDLLTILLFPLWSHLLPPSPLCTPLQPPHPPCFPTSAMPLPECFSTWYHGAHFFTPFVAFLKCPLLHEVSPGHPTENCNSFSWFIFLNSSCHFSIYIFLSLVKAPRVQGFLFLLYPEFRAMPDTQKPHDF